jgi:hypothetical protein
VNYKSQVGWKNIMTIEVRYSAMSPEPEALVLNKGVFAGAAIPTSSLAKRLDTLENKTVYLVDIGYGGSYKFMQAVQKWFKENMLSVTTIRRRKTGSPYTDDTTDLWDEIKAKGHAVVIGVAG